MEDQHIFDFKKDISRLNIPSKLNNPFAAHTSDIATLAAKEFQDYIGLESQNWNYDFQSQKGKMFGVLVVQLKNKTYSYLGAVSGNLDQQEQCQKFTPSVFDESTNDYFMTIGMTELTEIGTQILHTKLPTDITELKEIRKQKSIALQRQLFEHYIFFNLSGESKNLIDIFQQSSHGYPPSAAGDCAAPKLLQYAIRRQLKPIALTEFWWGHTMNTADMKHKAFYPACKNRCRPILEYMLEDTQLYTNRSLPNQS